MRLDQAGTWNAIGSEAIASNWLRAVSSPPGPCRRPGLAWPAHIEHRLTFGLPGQFASRQREHCRQHPRLHLRRRRSAQCRARRAPYRPPRFRPGKQRGERRPVGEHGKVGSGSSALVIDPCLEHVGGLDGHRPRPREGLGRRRPGMTTPRIGHVDGAEEIGAWPSRATRHNRPRPLGMVSASRRSLQLWPAARAARRPAGRDPSRRPAPPLPAERR